MAGGDRFFKKETKKRLAAFRDRVLSDIILQTAEAGSSMPEVRYETVKVMLKRQSK